LQDQASTFVTFPPAYGDQTDTQLALDPASRARRSAERIDKNAARLQRFRALIRRFGRPAANSASEDSHLSFSRSFGRSAFVPERKMNKWWRSEIEAKRDPLAQGSEARATFCSAKRLEDVKTTGKIATQRMLPRTCQESGPIVRRQRSKHRRYQIKTTGRALPVVLEVHCEVGVVSSRQGAKPPLGRLLAPEHI
jgi:hypothetical protein